jgi:hypothetical protein
MLIMKLFDLIKQFCMLLILFAFSSNSLALELQANVIYSYDLNANSLVVEETDVRYQKYAYDGDCDFIDCGVEQPLKSQPKKAQGGPFFTFEVGLVASKGLAGVPGRVQSRINLKSDGLKHTLNRHLNPASSGSQFSLSKDGLASLLQSKLVVNSPITQVLDSGNFLRVVNVGRNIGFDKFSRNRATSTLSVITDKFGNLVTATLGVIK